MAAMIERIRRGERCWSAEFILRSAGLAVLYLSAQITRGLCRLVNQPPPHPGSPLEFAIAAAAFVCLSFGLALSLEGAGLFRPVPLPPRALIA